MRKEGVFRLFRQIHIAASHLVAADDKFALHADRQLVSERICDIEQGVGNRTAHSHMLFAVHHRCGAAHCTLRWTVYVQDHAVLPQFPQAVVELARECLRSDIKESELPYGFPALRDLQQVQQIGGCTGYTVGSAALYKQRKCRRVVDLCFRGDDCCIPVAQGYKLLYYGHVEGKGGKRQVYTPRFAVVHDLNGFFIPVYIVGKIPMLDHNALGTSG